MNHSRSGAAGFGRTGGRPMHETRPARGVWLARIRYFFLAKPARPVETWLVGGAAEAASRPPTPAAHSRL